MADDKVSDNFAGFNRYSSYEENSVTREDSKKNKKQDNGKKVSTKHVHFVNESSDEIELSLHHSIESKSADLSEPNESLRESKSADVSTEPNNDNSSFDKKAIETVQTTSDDKVDVDDSNPEYANGDPEKGMISATAAKTMETAVKTVRIATNAMNVVIPKFKPLPVEEFFTLAGLVSIPLVLYIIGFTKMGYGVKVYQYLSTHFEHHAVAIGLGVSSLAFLLYLFDCSYWTNFLGKFSRRLAYSIIVLAVTATVIAVSGNHPYGPVIMYLVWTTLWLVNVRRFFFKEIGPRNYVTWLSGPLFCVSIVTFFSWFAWTFFRDENEWTVNTKLIDAQKTGCDPNFEDREYCRKEENSTDVCFYEDEDRPAYVHFPEGCDRTCADVYGQCLNTFIIWVGPFLASLGLVFLSFFTTFVHDDISAEVELVRFTKVWMVLLFGAWVSASLAGAGAGVTFALAALTLAGFIASGIFICAIYKQVERKAQMKRIWDDVMRKYEHYLDAVQGLLLLTCAPIVLAYLTISTVKQKLRQINWMQCSKAPLDTASLVDIGGEHIVTIEARRLIRDFRKWNRSAVYTWAIYFGIILLIFSVIASKFTTVFLSWLIQTTVEEEYSLITVTAIMIGVGVIMFLLPPVPGAPIYLTTGIVIIPVGSKTFGMTGSIIYAICVSFLLKLFATALQQKAIGGLLKDNVRVRKLVGVNSTLMRAMKLLLQKEGLGLAKIGILCGGPDWPTSVLCGIMGLPLVPILIGTMPIMALVIPTVLTGSFTYMGGLSDESGVPDYPWAGLASTICAAAAAIVLFGNMVLAAYYVEQTVSNDKEALAAIPLDEEVKKLEEEEEAFNEAFDQVTEWDGVPLLPRLTLTAAVICMIVSCYLVFFFQASCFREYSLTDTIDVQLDGDWTKLVKPLGSVSLLLFVISILLFSGFSIWAKREAKEKCRSQDMEVTVVK